MIKLIKCPKCKDLAYKCNLCFELKVGDIFRYFWRKNILEYKVLEVNYPKDQEGYPVYKIKGIETGSKANWETRGWKGFENIEMIGHEYENKDVPCPRCSRNVNPVKETKCWHCEYVF